MQSESRQRAGFEALPDLDTLWGKRDVFHVNALRAFDGESRTHRWPARIEGHGHCAWAFRGLQNASIGPRAGATFTWVLRCGF